MNLLTPLLCVLEKRLWKVAHRGVYNIRNRYTTVPASLVMEPDSITYHRRTWLGRRYLDHQFCGAGIPGNPPGGLAVAIFVHGAFSRAIVYLQFQCQRELRWVSLTVFWLGQNISVANVNYIANLSYIANIEFDGQLRDKCRHIFLFGNNPLSC